MAGCERGTVAAADASLESFVVRAKVPPSEQLALLPYELRDQAGFRILRALSQRPGSRR